MSLPRLLSDFREVWVIDTEFGTPPGDFQQIRCLVALEYGSGRELRLWADELPRKPPFTLGPEALFVAYFASAELRNMLSLGWGTPCWILDLYPVFRALNNGRRPAGGYGQLGALAHYGIDAMGVEDKTVMRDLALRGGLYTPREKTDLINYCAADVASLAQLLTRMAPDMDLPRALYWGRYTAAVARMENTGLPVDVDEVSLLQRHWEPLQTDLIAEVDKDFGLYEGTTFKQDRFEAWLKKTRIPWPRTDTGLLSVEDETFKQQAKTYLQIAPLHELRATLGKMRLNKIEVGNDGRARTLLFPFATITGRNQPSTAKYLFSCPTWMRSLIRPGPGRGLAYVDWSSQEFAIAAALSGDPAMIAAYQSGDPYLSLAIQAGAAPPTATRETHKEIRDLFKVVALALSYGMGEYGLSRKTERPALVSRRQIRAYHEVFSTFCGWSEGRKDYAMLHGHIETNMGWPLLVDDSTNPRTLLNFPMQAHGADMMRCAAILATEAGITINGPVHDAFLIESNLSDLDDTVEEMQKIMRKAGRIVLKGFELRTDVEVVRYPHRYRDARGQRVWEAIWTIVGRQKG